MQECQDQQYRTCETFFCVFCFVSTIYKVQVMSHNTAYRHSLIRHSKKLVINLCSCSCSSKVQHRQCAQVPTRTLPPFQCLRLIHFRLFNGGIHVGPMPTSCFYLINHYSTCSSTSMYMYIYHMLSITSLSTPFHLIILLIHARGHRSLTYTARLWHVAGYHQTVDSTYTAYSMWLPIDSELTLPIACGYHQTVESTYSMQLYSFRQWKFDIIIINIYPLQWGKFGYTIR